MLLASLASAATRLNPPGFRWMPLARRLPFLARRHVAVLLRSLADRVDPAPRNWDAMQALLREREVTLRRAGR